MNLDRPNLEQRRDHALRDLRELEEQVTSEEIAPEVAVRLRRDYEREAADAIAALSALSETRSPPDPIDPATSRRALRLHPRHLISALGVLALAAAVVLLPGYVLDRPQGGFVTGNEALQGATPTASPAPGPDLSKVTDQEMEAVVAANPDVIGMRLALANRYTAKGRYDLASVHYRRALEQDPGNADAKAHLGWLMLQIDRPREAIRLVDQALATQPDLLDALWFRANIRLYGLKDARGAMQVLDALRSRRDLAPEVRQQVEDLRKSAAAKVTK